MKAASVTGYPAVLAALVDQLDHSQWAPAAAIRNSQFRQLTRLAEWCAVQSPAFADRLDRAGLTAADLGDPSKFVTLPVLTRRDVQCASHDLYCRQVPSGHENIAETRTSGSTGEPVVVRRTPVTRLFWHAMTMRDYRWHEQNVSARLCAIRAGVAECRSHPSWGPPASLLTETGPAFVAPVTADASRLASWIDECRPGYLVIYPSTLQAIVRYCQQIGMTFSGLRHIRTIGETLPPPVRRSAEAAFGARVTDCYSSQEIGYIAIECPDSGLYHVVAESVIVEVLDDAGRPCRPGEVGRIVVTDLHNFATPLIRYDIGDFGEAAGACPCGRGLPTLKRIAGRQRNFILMPDGSRYWPVTGFNRCRDVAPIAQYQLVQRSRETIEARLVVDRPLSAAEEDRLRSMLHECAGYPFDLTITAVDRIPVGPTGKYEEFVCEVSADDRPRPEFAGLVRLKGKP